MVSRGQTGIRKYVRVKMGWRMESGHEPNGDWVNNWIEVDTYLVNIIVYLMGTSMLSDIIEIYMFRICLFS